MEKNSSSIITIAAVALVIILGWFLISNSSSDKNQVNKNTVNIAIAEGTEAIVFYDPGCGCCGNHATYLGRNGFDVTRERMDSREINVMKENLGVPMNMLSCHTTMVGNYFVEGHMPIEAIAKLLDEKPNIKGIAMPGMPAGSPGMGGAKNEDFVIWSVGLDGSIEEFMRI